MPDISDSSSSTPRPYSASLSGKAGLLDETLTVLQLVAQGQGPEELRSSVLESDVLGKATHENRRSIWDKLHQRYLADWNNAVRLAKMVAASSDRNSASLLIYYEFCRSEPILYDAVTGPVFARFTAGYSGVFDKSYKALLASFRPVYEDLHRQRDELYARLSSELKSEGVQIDHLRTYVCEGPLFDPATVGCAHCGHSLNLMAEQLLAMPAATHVLREAHRKELAASTGAKRKVSRISVSSLLAGRQIEGEADLDQALQMVKDAARRALQDGNVVELI